MMTPTSHIHCLSLFLLKWMKIYLQQSLDDDSKSMGTPTKRCRSSFKCTPFLKSNRDVHE